jgi:hypothetical protein
MENSTASSTTTSDDGFGLFAAEFGINTFKSDLVRWNKDWETVLRTISSKDVYSVFSELMYKIGLGDPSTLSPMIQKFTDRVCRHQEQAIDAWAELEKDDRFSMPWMLLDEKEQRKHLLNGVRGACTSSAWRQDTRAMCPEIVLSSLTKRHGRAFIDFTSDCIKGFKDVGTGTTYNLPSKWWDEAVDSSKPLTETADKIFALLTIQRNEFISESHIVTRILF